VNDPKGLQGTSLLSVPVQMLFDSPSQMADGNLDDDVDSSRGPTAAMEDPNHPDPSHTQEMLAANQVELRTITTLHAMDDLAVYLATLPGRKNLIWFSGSFPVDIMPTMNEQGETSPLGAAPQPGGMADNPFATVKSQEKGFQKASALLSRAQVAVYPIDVKGLKSASFFSATENGCANCTGGPEQAIQDFADHNYGEHATMLELADGTGGKAAINTNDFSTAMRKALDDGANYYTIAYTPSDPNWDGKFRPIEVKLRQKGNSLSYRKGYFAEEVGDPSGSKPMQLALLHGGPEPTQILFSTQVQPVGVLPETAVAANNKPGAGAKGPYRRYQVEFSVDAKSLLFTQSADGHRHVALEFMAYVYRAEGAPENTVGRSMKLDVSVPTRGTYSLRLAVHNVGDDHVGAVELPVASVSRLAPLEASAAK